MLRVPLPAPPRAGRATRPSPRLPAVVAAFEAAAFARAQDGLILDRPTTPADPARLRTLLACAPLTLDLALDHALRDAAHRALCHGWGAGELIDFARPRVDGTTLGYLVDVLGLAAQWSAAATWLAQLDRLGHRPWWTSANPHAAQWAQRHGVDRATLAAIAVDVLALLTHLPRTHAAQPDTPAASGAAAGILLRESRIATKIDALFARAAGTTFTDEAEACAAKAQELLLRYSRPVLEGVGTITRVAPLPRVGTIARAGTISRVGTIGRAAAPHRVRPRPRPRPRAAIPA